MASSPLRFSKALVLGATEPIGKALAKYLISIGKTVVVVGYPEAAITAVNSEIGAFGTLIFDAGNARGQASEFADFVKAVGLLNPPIDCIVNAAEAHSPLDLTRLKAPAPNLDTLLQGVDQQLDRNLRGPMHITTRLLPLLRQSPTGGRIINVGSVRIPITPAPMYLISEGGRI
jgi:NAD(P)-dependent dehydrogenase (short-subunit alcohol dehydrogenase family)